MPTPDPITITSVATSATDLLAGLGLAGLITVLGTAGLAFYFIARGKRAVR